MIKILFIGPTTVDYLTVCILQALTVSKGISTYVYQDFWYMYDDTDDLDEVKKLYGKGFSYWGRIKRENVNIIREDEVERMITNRFFDYIFYGSLNRCLDYYDLVSRSYSPEQIAFADGDDTDFSRYVTKNIFYASQMNIEINRKRKQANTLAEKHIVFKRELRYKDSNHFLPISFAISEEDILTRVPKKKIKMATMIPGKIETYIYEQEKDYYQGYRDAEFAYTFKKGGWDCMRHYEILMNGCVPYFSDIEDLPLFTMIFFPQKLCLQAKKMYDSEKYSDNEYRYLAEELLEYTRKYLTTKKLGEYILSKIVR